MHGASGNPLRKCRKQCIATEGGEGRSASDQAGLQQTTAVKVRDGQISKSLTAVATWTLQSEFSTEV